MYYMAWFDEDDSALDGVGLGDLPAIPLYETSQLAMHE